MSTYKGSQNSRANYFESRLITLNARLQPQRPISGRRDPPLFLEKHSTVNTKPCVRRFLQQHAYDNIPLDILEGLCFICRRNYDAHPCLAFPLAPPFALLLVSCAHTTCQAHAMQRPRSFPQALDYSHRLLGAGPTYADRLADKISHLWT